MDRAPPYGRTDTEVDQVTESPSPISSSDWAFCWPTDNDCGVPKKKDEEEESQHVIHSSCNSLNKTIQQ